MRERIVARAAGARPQRSDVDAARWRELRDRRRRHRDQHHRRVLPVAAARVPARGRPRPGLRHGRRDRGAAPRRRGARPRAAHRPGRGARTTTSRWCSRSWASAQLRDGPGARCSTAGSWPGRRCGGSWRRGRADLTRGRRLPARGDGAADAAGAVPGGAARGSSRRPACTIRASSCSARDAATACGRSGRARPTRRSRASSLDRARRATS